MVTTGNDGTVRQYVIAIPDLLALAATRVTRSLSPAERATYLAEPLPTPSPVAPVLTPPAPTLSQVLSPP